MSQDELKMEGILSMGYGIIPKLVMRDKEISVEAKAIYAYISSYAGNGSTAYPGIELICNDLDISENRFHKHKKQLIEKGYIEVTKERSKTGNFGKNVYTIKSQISINPTRQNEGTVPTLQNPGMENPSMDNPGMENEGTNNNSLTNNIFNNNNLKNNQQQPASSEPPKINFIQTWEQCGFGTIAPITMQKLDDWVKDFNDNEEIIVKAIEVANDNNVRRYKYVETILKSWEDRGVKTLADIDALEQQRSKEIEDMRNKPSAPKSNYNKKPVRKETLPEWAKPGYEPPKETPLDSEAEKEIKERLERLKNLQSNNN